MPPELIRAFGNLEEGRRRWLNRDLGKLPEEKS